MRFARHLLLAAIVAWTVPAIARSQSVADHLGPLEATVGIDPPWETSLTGGWFLMTNRTNADSIRYYWMPGEPVRGGERKMKVTVIALPDGTDANLGGLLFDFADGQNYLAFTIRSNGDVVLLQRTADGLDQTISKGVRAKLDGSDVLEIVEGPRKATFHVNGKLAFSADDPDGFSPTFGVIAFGRGRVGFDGFEIEEAVAAAPLPAPGGGETPLPAPGGGGETPLPAPAGGGEETGGGTAGGGGGTGGGDDPFAEVLATAAPERIYHVKVVFGITFGIFFHELGHALIGELDLPATGPEEDVADRFSSFILTRIVEEAELAGAEAEANFLADVVRYASLYWYYSGVQMEQAGRRPPWQDEHAPDLTRFRNSFCIVYGSNPARYEKLADAVEFGDRAKFRCQEEFKKGYSAWERILKPVSRNLGPDSPGDLPSNAPGGRVVVNFVESNSTYGNMVEVVLRDFGAMADLAKGLEETYVWPRDLQIVFRDCEEINAWYDPEKGMITMCYSLVKYASELVFDAERAGAGGG